MVYAWILYQLYKTNKHNIITRNWISGFTILNYVYADKFQLMNSLPELSIIFNFLIFLD